MHLAVNYQPSVSPDMLEIISGKKCELIPISQFAYQKWFGNRESSFTLQLEFFCLQLSFFAYSP